MLLSCLVIITNNEVVSSIATNLKSTISSPDEKSVVTSIEDKEHCFKIEVNQRNNYKL